MRPRRVRPWWERVAALCAAAWFLVVALDLPALHTCAMHGGGSMPASHAGVTAAAPDASHGDHAAAHAASPAGDAMARHGLTHHEQAPAHAGHLCTCLGACCGAVLATTPAPALAFHTRVTDRPTAPGRPAHEYVAAWVDFVLPFSTAPPARVIV